MKMFILKEQDFMFNFTCETFKESKLLISYKRKNDFHRNDKDFPPLSKGHKYFCHYNLPSYKFT